MAKKQRGGVNIRDSKVGVSGDVVGRDKIEEHQHFGIEARDEKSGFLLFIERAVIFVLGLLIAGAVFGAIGLAIGAALGATELGTAIGLIFALGFAIAAASNVSRYR